MRWTSDRYDQIEHAARNHLRVVLRRRGTEYVVTATRLGQGARGDVLHGRLPMTGELMAFPLHELDGFQVLGPGE